MGSGFIDILLFALIAAFLVLRLRSVLGRRDGHSGGPRDPFGLGQQNDSSSDNIVRLPDQSQGSGVEDIAAGDQEPLSALESGLMYIRQADPQFDTEEFLVGGRTAFEMILSAFMSGDKESLQPFLAPDVYENFASVVDGRERDGETVDGRVLSIKASEIVEAYLDGRIANITMKFVSDQVIVTRNNEGEIVDGDPETITEVTDFWTFARDTRSRDPNWTLVATRSLE